LISITLENSLDMLRRKIYLISTVLLLPGYLILSLSCADAAMYTYDSLLRITMADYESGFIEEYTYDAAGNRLMVTVTSKWISGNGYTSPEPGASAEISVDISVSSLETGILTYTDTKSGVTLINTSISGLVIDSGIAVITGKCTINGFSGYSYRATLTDTGPDTVEIEIYNADGTVHFSTNKNILINGDLSIGTEPANRYHLTTSLSPSSGGSLSPDCSTGCLYENGTLITITANENSGYAFTGWSGCDSAANNICVITMDSDKTAAALFLSCGNTVRIARTNSIYFSSLQNAYDVSQESDNIHVQSTVFSEDIHIDRDISITLQGGFDCTFYNNGGVTTLDGSMTISNGTVTLEGFVIE
jgi:YD repeat-containing protein